ncbi:MAG TPA: hypothetical protein VMR98_00795 [Candidatus Polarisedimenticolaceae bacterium]|nr:hypothetical protein [Candidatus Polarisedimenticolaceae bacterium]
MMNSTPHQVIKRTVQALVATPKRRLTLLPLALAGSFAVGLALSLFVPVPTAPKPANVSAAGETNILDPASYTRTSDFYQERVYRFEVEDYSGGRGTADITVSPDNNGITRQVN